MPSPLRSEAPRKDRSRDSERAARFRASISKTLAGQWRASPNGRLFRHIDLVRHVPQRWCAATSYPVDPVLSQCVCVARARTERGSAGRRARGQQLPPDRPPRRFAPKPVLRRTATIDRRAERRPVGSRAARDGRGHSPSDSCGRRCLGSRRPSQTGLPDGLKRGVQNETASGRAPYLGWQVWPVIFLAKSRSCCGAPRQGCTAF